MGRGCTSPAHPYFRRIFSLSGSSYDRIKYWGPGSIKLYLFQKNLFIHPILPQYNRKKSRILKECRISPVIRLKSKYFPPCSYSGLMERIPEKRIGRRGDSQMGAPNLGAEQRRQTTSPNLIFLLPQDKSERLHGETLDKTGYTLHSSRFAHGFLD